MYIYTCVDLVCSWYILISNNQALVTGISNCVNNVHIRLLLLYGYTVDQEN